MRCYKKILSIKKETWTFLVLWKIWQLKILHVLKIWQAGSGGCVPHSKDLGRWGMPLYNWMEKEEVQDRGYPRLENMTVSRWQKWPSQEWNKLRNFSFMFMLLAVTQPSYRLKSIFPGNQLFLLQLDIQTGQPRVILITNEGEDASTSEQFPSLCFKSRKLYRSPHPRTNKKRYLYQAHKQPNLPGYVPIPNLHRRKTWDTSRAQVMSCSQAGMGGYSSTMPQLLCRPQIPGACSFMANWQLLFPREDMWLARWTISGFPAQSCCWPGEAAQVWDLLCLQVKALRATDRLCLAKKPYSPFASFSSVLRATSPSTATRCKRANHGRKWVLSMGVQIS